MAQKRFYAVRVGHKPGIYQTWEECRIQVEGYPNAVYKGFAMLSDATAYLNGHSTPNTAPPTLASTDLPHPQFDAPKLKEVVIYTDGACTGNPGPGGYGVVLL